MDEQDYEELRKEKNHLNKKIHTLRETLKIRSGRGLGNNLPAHIINHPSFERYKKYCKRIKELDDELSKIPKQIKHSCGLSWPQRFMKAVEVKYPNIFEEIISEIGNTDEPKT